jgi:hypothetical protein
LFNESSNIDKYRSSVSEVTAAKPRKIVEWSKNKENKLKRLFLVEKKSIHSIARMLGGREYEIAEALERFGFVKEPIKLTPKVYSNHVPKKKEEYVPKWAREDQPPAEPVHVATAPVATESSSDPRIDALERLLEKREYYFALGQLFASEDTSKMTIKERVKHDIDCAKTQEMYLWFSNSYDMSLKKLAAQATEAGQWADNA